MSGPQPFAAIAFRNLYEAISKLHAASVTPTQQKVINNLVAGLRECEPLWGITRFPNGKIDTRRPVTEASLGRNQNKFHYTTRETIKAYEAGRRHRNNGYSIDANYFDPSDPCHAAFDDGWRDRSTEIGG